MIDLIGCILCSKSWGEVKAVWAAHRELKRLNSLRNIVRLYTARLCKRNGGHVTVSNTGTGVSLTRGNKTVRILLVDRDTESILRSVYEGLMALHSDDADHADGTRLKGR